MDCFVVPPRNDVPATTFWSPSLIFAYRYLKIPPNY